MRLARLRNQMLIAMGLPACWIQPAPGPGPGPGPGAPGAGPVDYAAPPPAEGPPDGSFATPAPGGWRAGRFVPASCVPDSLPETVCGRSDTREAPAACGATGDRLESFGTSRVYVTEYSRGANDTVLAPFRLDPDATAHYQRTVKVSPTMTPRYCCYSRCTALSVRPMRPLADPGPGFRIDQRCIPQPPGGTRRPHPSNAACPSGLRLGGAAMPYLSGQGGQCCYGAVVAIPPREERKYYRGRAARVEGQAVVAPTGAHAGWRDAPVVPSIDQLAPALRARLADAWTRAAQMEHASIASFSALSLRLLALGAPSELVAAAHQAALDEIRHARVAFELASAYAGHAVGPAAFAEASRVSTTGGFTELAIETFLDGCIAETAAALEADRAADVAVDPQVAAALREIAADEGRHAELAWAIVAWCVREVGPALVTELRAALGALALPASPTDTDTEVGLASHGVLGERELATIRNETVHDVVIPCLDALAA